MAVEKFVVAGTYYHMAAIQRLAVANPEWRKSGKTLAAEGRAMEEIPHYLYKNSPVELVPEPKNPHDKNAIKVMIAGEHVGYISRDENVHVGSLLQSKRITGVTAEISGEVKAACNDGTILTSGDHVRIVLTVSCKQPEEITIPKRKIIYQEELTKEQKKAQPVQKSARREKTERILSIVFLSIVALIIFVVIPIRCATTDTLFTQWRTRQTAPTATPAPSGTLGERNALASAESYLSFTAFSRSGLIKQLEYEGYTESEALYAVENCGADWYEQAAKSAESYLSHMSFSRSGLIKQLEYEGFTHEQAEYGVKAVGY